MAKRLSAEQGRETIARAAQGLFAEKGLQGVSVDEIVNVVEVSPAVLDKYFPCREAL